jgi:CubicO group peptidase (beta-lactamase class C family)
MRELVFGPLDMLDSGYGPDFVCDRSDRVAVGHGLDGIAVDGGWRVYPSAAGGLWTTAGDLGRIAVEIQKARTRQRTKLLDHSAATRLLTPIDGTSYGLGTVVRFSDGINWFGHSGETLGYRSHSVFGLESGAGLVIMTNGEAGNDLIMDLLVNFDVNLRVWIDLTPDFQPGTSTHQSETIRGDIT